MPCEPPVTITVFCAFAISKLLSVTVTPPFTSHAQCKVRQKADLREWVPGEPESALRVTIQLSNDNPNTAPGVAIDACRRAVSGCSVSGDEDVIMTATCKP